MITDDNGNNVSYIPVSLLEGTQSPPRVLRVYPETDAETIKAEETEEFSLWAKKGAGAFQNVTQDPLDVSDFFGGYGEISVKIIAAADVPGVVRKMVFLGSETGKPAEWLS